MLRTLLPSLLLIAFLASCSTEEKPATGETGTTDTLKTPTNGMLGQEDHRVSELAQMMREMAAFADSTKARLGRGAELPPYPEKFKTMVVAESTPGMVDHTVFDPFAFAWLRQLDTLYQVPAARRDEAYNGLVQHCASCHGTVCPGPLVRIKKMYRPIEP